MEANKFNWNCASIEWQNLTKVEVADNYGHAQASIEEKMGVEYELLAACG
jgi:hypothetical protein